MFSSSCTISCSVYIHYIGNKVILTSSPYHSINIFVCDLLDGKYRGSLFACNESHNMLWPLYKFGDCGSQCYSTLESVWKLIRNCVTGGIIFFHWSASLHVVRLTRIMSWLNALYENKGIIIEIVREYYLSLKKDKFVLTAETSIVKIILITKTKYLIIYIYINVIELKCIHILIIEITISEVHYFSTNRFTHNRYTYIINYCKIVRKITNDISIFLLNF